MRRISFFTIFFMLLGVLSVAAQGIVVPCEPPPCPDPAQTCPMIDCPIINPGVFTDPEWLSVDYHRVTVNVDNQIATTNVDMQFTNTGNALAEGTFVFPLPAGAAVDQLTMYVNGQAIEARILDADQAREVYDAIVRQYRDPALLEYIGTGAIQANVFPIPPGESRRIELSYAQVLEVDNGLIQYVYPLNTSTRAVGQMSISVTVTGSDSISNIYSPSHPIALSRSEDTTGFSAGFEQTSFIPGGDFVLYYGIASDTINVNLLTYREGANQDGFFMLLVQPPLQIDESQIQPKDVIVVLDQSGSMSGEKWTQARDAAIYVLENLNAGDRFNVILFSTGFRVYGEGLQSPEMVADAVQWLNSQEPNGGTDINIALTAALEMADPERQTTIIFLTDGIPTEGVVDSAEILANAQQIAPPNVKIFTFGVGFDVDTILLDSIVQVFNGAGSYVRPSERVDEAVASLVTKISSPVLTNISLDFGGIRTELQYPVTLPDLYAGTQLTLVGRYRDTGENITITLTGTINGEQQTFVYSNLSFRTNAGGDPFIARLWATRRIGDLLNQIRLHGENPELVDSIIDLSIRYGIITPYTSFLIDENDILTQTGRDDAAANFAEEAEQMAASPSGEAAVNASDTASGLADADAPAGVGGGAGGQPTGTPTAGGTMQTGNTIVTVNDKTFILQGEVWVDTAFAPDTMTTQQVVFLSDEYFALLDLHPLMGDYLALGERVIIVIDGVAYETVP